MKTDTRGERGSRRLVGAIPLAMVIAVIMAATATIIFADDTSHIVTKNRPPRFDSLGVKVTADDVKRSQREWAEHLGTPVEWENSQRTRFSLIPPGEFAMGRAPTKPDYFDTVPGSFRFLKEDGTSLDEERHPVLLTRAFYLGQTEVTRGEFFSYLKANPNVQKEWTAAEVEVFTGDSENPFAYSRASDKTFGDFGWPQDDQHPITNVSWREANDYCAWLTKTERASGLLKANESYRLPSEAEWEYACRAGTTTRYNTGDDPESLVAKANVCFRTDKVFDKFAFTSPARSFPANALGLFDMHGNAAEWCFDVFSGYSLTPAWNIDPVRTDGMALTDKDKPDDATIEDYNRVVRGGAFAGDAFHLRSSARNNCWEVLRSCQRGFRLVREIAQPATRVYHAYDLAAPKAQADGKHAPFELDLGGDAELDDQPKDYRIPANEALEMGKGLIAAIEAGDPDKALEYFDFNAHCHLALRNLGMIANSITHFELQARKDPQKLVFATWCRNYADGTRIKILRTRIRDGRRTLVVRLDDIEMTLTHFELYLKRDAEGIARVEDIYLYSSGFRMSEIIRDILLERAGLGDLNNVPTGQYGLAFVPYDKQRKRIAERMKLLALPMVGRRPRPGDVYDSLVGDIDPKDADVVISRNALILAIQAGEALSPQLHLRAAVKFSKLFPMDPGAATQLAMPLLHARRFADALEAIEITDTALGGDPFLAYSKSTALIGLGKIPQAEEVIRKAMAEEPDLGLLPIQLATIQCHKKDYAGAVETIREVLAQFPMVAIDAFEDPEEFPGLKGTEEFRDLKKELLVKKRGPNATIEDESKPRTVPKGRTRRPKPDDPADKTNGDITPDAP